MDAEIELKLFFLPEFKNTLINEINHLFIQDFQSDVLLGNGYFDTPDLQLRHWDMGLRVRTRNGAREQTIKTAGSVVGGIHSRPEYNVAIDSDVPALALFPAGIWPEGADIAAVQAQLGCVFQTDFRRMTWHVSQGQSRIEIALDEGVIRSGEHSEPLCELEFELLDGVATDLLTLAQQLCTRVPLRLGKASKAQRGYRLAGLGGKRSLDVLDAVPLATVTEESAAFRLILQTALERWQLLEDLLGQSVGDPLSSAPLWVRLRTCIALLEGSCRQFGCLDATLEAGFHAVLTRLDFVDELQALTVIMENRDSLLGRRPDAQRWQDEALQRLGDDNLLVRLEALWRVPEYGQVQLALVQLLLGKPQLAPLPLRTVAGNLLQQGWEGIAAVCPEGSGSLTEFLALEHALDEALLIGMAYGELYPQEARKRYRAPWLDLRRGIVTLRAYALLGRMAGPDAEMQDWLEDKSLSLMFALEQSRRSALSQQPYWA